jgi:hypothetical protein
MRYLGKPFFVGLFCILCFCSLAQSDSTSFWSTLSIGAKAHYGFLVVNQPKSEYVRDSHTCFGELTLSTQTSGKKQWQQVNHNPQIGISLLYGNSGSREYIGHVAALFPYMKFPLFKTAHSITSFRLGFGAGWVQKPYNKETNTKNLLIGSALNGCINMVFEQEWQLHKNCYLNAGFSFTHLSNGSFKLPNLGLNIPALSLGVRYAFEPVQPVNEKQQWPAFKKKWHFSAFTYAAGKQSYPLESPVYLVNTVMIEAAKDISPTGRLGAGLNGTRDPSLSHETETFEFEKNDPQWQVSAYALYERVIGNLSIPFQVGFYLYNKYQITSYYQVIGLRYRFLPHWVAGLQLKAHLGKADYLQYGLGYKF